MKSTSLIYRISIVMIVLSMTPTMAMNKPSASSIDNAAKRIRVAPVNNPFELLPKEICQIILTLVINANSFAAITRQTVHLQKVDKAFNRWVNDPEFTETLVEHIAQGAAAEFINKAPFAGGQLNRLNAEFASQLFALSALHTRQSITQLNRIFIRYHDTINIGAFVLIQASATKNLGIVDSLLKAGLYPDMRCNFDVYVSKYVNALGAAAMNNFLPGVKLLLTAGADPNANCLTILIPTRNWNKELIDTLRAAGAKESSFREFK